MKNNVPSKWSIKNISEIANTSSGGTPSRSNIQFYTNGIYPWVKTGELGNKYLYDAEEYITEDAINNSSAKLIEKNSVIMAMYGATIGKMSINKVEVTTNQACCSISCNKNIYNYEFLYYILSLQKENIIKLGAGGAQPNISQEIIKRYKILCPPLEEQDKIAEILSTWDLAIEKQEQLIEKKKEFKKGLMQNLYSKGTKKEKLVKSKLGEVPESWNIVKAKEVFKSVSIKNNENEELLSVTQDKGTIPRSQLEGNVVMPEGSTSGYKLVVPNNFIISLRSFQGGLEISKHRGIISPAYTVLENKIEICHDYFKYYFKKEEFISRLNGAIVGIRDGKQISYADFGEMFLPVPSLEEQIKIAEILMVADKEIELLEKELEVLKLQKKGLMQRLLTGEVRVKV